MIAKTTAIVRALRPKQWSKNLVVFAALLFSLRVGDLQAVLRVLASFGLFCAASGAVYLVNDVVDRDRDRLHPTKRFRPIAAGQIGPVEALLLSALFVVGAVGLGAVLETSLGGVLAAYYLLNLGYSTYLKQVVIVDVLSIAAGFVLRAIAGAWVIAVEVSPWLLLCAFLLALFLALCKRRSELANLEEEGMHRRPVLREYRAELLDQLVSISAAATIIAYSLYTISEHALNTFGTKRLFYTVPFVVFGLFRYLYLVQQHNKGDAPEQVLVEDAPLIAGILLWLAGVVGILYWS